MSAPPNSWLEDERRLLKLAGVKYYRNQECIFPGSPLDNADLMLRYALIPLPSREAELANLVIYLDELGEQFASTVTKRTSLIGRMPGEYTKLMFDAARRGLTFEKELSLDEFRRGPAAGFDKLGDELRRNETAREKCKILMMQGAANIASHVEARFTPKLSSRPLGTKTALAIYPHAGDQVGIERDGKKSWMPGWFVKFVHDGTAPLTNVVVITRLRTTGPSIALTEGQAATLGFNDLTGFGDKVPDIARMFVAGNYYISMPKTHFFYVPRINPGDVVDLPIGDTEMKFAPSAALSLFSDQGGFVERPFALTQWMYEGPTKDMPPFVRKGATRAEITAQLGELDKSDRDAWAKTGQNAGSVPADAECRTWGRSQYTPKLYLAFRGDRLEAFEWYVPPRRKPEIAGTPLKLDSRGAAVVKSDLEMDAPVHRGLRMRHKVFTAQLTTGKTYVLNMASTTGAPFIAVENEYGDELGRGKKKERPRQRRIPSRTDVTMAATEEAELVFTPKVDGEYRIVCGFTNLVAKPRDFTLTVQPR